MKIAFFSMSTAKGGAERVISLLANRFAGAGHEVFILSCLKGGQAYEYEKCIKTISLIEESEYREKGKARTFLKINKRYREEICGIKPDVVICFLPIPCMVGALNKKASGAVVIGSERSNPRIKYKSAAFRAVINRLYSRLDGFVCQTEAAREFFGKSLQRKTFVISNPLNPELNEFVGYRPKTRDKRIVAVGRDAPEKNYPMLVKAFARVHAEFPEYVLEIYGLCKDDSELRRLVSGEKLKDAIIFKGQTDDIYNAIKDASLYVLSSISEGLPNALMEAMALRIPIVATDCPIGGPASLIEDGVNGLLVKNDDAEALANGIKRMLKDPEFAESCGEKAKDIVRTNSVESIAGEWMEVIGKFVGA